MHLDNRIEWFCYISPQVQNGTSNSGGLGGGLGGLGAGLGAGLGGMTGLTINLAVPSPSGAMCSTGGMKKTQAATAARKRKAEEDALVILSYSNIIFIHFCQMYVLQIDSFEKITLQK